MRKFNTPPDWPDPPTARWRPPRRWRPNESWPPAPAGWSFWVDERGRPVRGPFGRYGGPNTVKLAAVVVVPLALIGALLFYKPFSSGDTVTSTAPEPTAIRSTSVAPTESPTLRRTEKPTRQIDRTPTSTPAPEPSPTPQGTLVVEPTAPGPSATPTVSSTPSTSVVSAVQYRDCAEVRAAGKAPLHRGDPGYSRDLDRNGDGIACERGNS
ncbi:excalibur calcium-binding domain-containing protein [Kribbella sp. NPDC050241]|uniref:excalibur calcium-binding domain-containing protein n=1 Tax=Kribbella sp. NPDC050241 TaxID=3364115 RepID=UPI0037BD958B